MSLSEVVEDERQDKNERSRLRPLDKDGLLDISSPYRCAICELQHRPHVGLGIRSARLRLTGQTRGWQYHYGAAVCPTCFERTKIDSTIRLAAIKAFAAAEKPFLIAGAVQVEFGCYACGASAGAGCLEICPKNFSKTNQRRLPGLSPAAKDASSMRRK